MNPARLAPALLLFFCTPVFAKAPAPYYLPPESLNISTVLPDPPAPGTPANDIDLQAVLAWQQSRTAADIARARSEAAPSLTLFNTVLGPRFTATNFPITFTVLNHAGSDASAISSSAKRFWSRPRPPLQDAAVHPVIQPPASGSYPSGHAMLGALWAALLAQVDPSLQARLIARGEQIGDDRVIAGVHFPTDVAAGRKLGRLIAARLLANPQFQTDLSRAQAEFNRKAPVSPQKPTASTRAVNPVLLQEPRGTRFIRG